MKREHVIIIATIIAIFVCFTSWRMVFHPYKIPTNAMAPTLQIGDYIGVNKFIYGIRLPVLNIKIVRKLLLV